MQIYNSNNDYTSFVIILMVEKFHNYLRKTQVKRLLIFIGMTVIIVSGLNAKPTDKLMNRPYADLKRWHLGFSVGFHVQDLNLTHNGFLTPDGEKWAMEVPNFAPGFCLNVLADLRLHQYLNLRFSPGIYFGSKEVIMQEYDTGTVMKQDVKSAYVVAPIDLKISGNRKRNVRPYITTGFMASFDVTKKRTDFLVFNTCDAYLTIGMGLDFYLPFFKFIPEVKFCFGLSDILKHNRPDLVDDPYTYKITQSLSKVKSNMIVVNFYFE